MCPESVKSRIDRIIPSAYPRTSFPILTWLALFAICLFALSNFFDAGVARDCEWLLLLITAIAAKQVRHEEPDAWLYLVLFGFLGLMLAVNEWAATHWDGAYNHFSYSRDYLRMFWFLIAGWWMGGRERSVFLIFAITVAALFLSIFIKGGITSWQQLFEGQRVDFDLHNAQHTAILFGSVLIGLLAFIVRFFTTQRPPFPALIMRTLWIILFIATALVVLGTQSRQIWVGFAAAAVVSCVFVIATSQLRRITLRRLAWGAVLAGLVIAAGQWLNAFAPMEKRLSHELGAATRMQEHALTEDMVNSTTIRLSLWRIALDSIAERPWFGYGGAGREIILEHSGPHPGIPAGMAHFHNSYLELWVSYGIMGPLMFLGILGLLAKRIISAYRQKSLALDFALFGLAWLTFFAVVNLFESYVSYRSGAYLMLLVGGGLYSLTIPARRSLVRAEGASAC